MEPEKSWTNSYTVYSFLCNNRGKLQVSSIAKLLQESAWEHAEHWGAGYHTLKPLGLVWILYGLRIEIECYPSWGEQLELETWGKNYETLFAFRDFRITQKGKDVPDIMATSSWLLVNAVNHRPQRITDKLHKIPVNPVNALDTRPGEIILPDEMKFIDIHKVVYSDIDIYNHVNNTRYIQFCIDSVGDLYENSDRIRSVDIRFIQEAKLGEELKITFKRQEDRLFFQARNNSSEKEIFRAQVVLNGE